MRDEKALVMLTKEASVLKNRKRFLNLFRTDSSFIGMTVFICIFFLVSFSSKKNKKFIPPGTVPITETFFADETEVSNSSWMEYEYWIKTKYGSASPQHITILPDTLVWLEKGTHNKPYVDYYFRHPAYRDYPVVGISHEQAVAFCKWRTDRVKEFWYIKHKQELNIEFRLPTKQEWELISNNGIDIFNNKDGWDSKKNKEF